MGTGLPSLPPPFPTAWHPANENTLFSLLAGKSEPAPIFNILIIILIRSTE
jgi:hypothetical protein